MLRHIRGIDHVIVLVRDLDRARDAYARMGFTLTPRGFHSLGSQNHCIMFGSDYIELMALPKVHPSLQYFADFLARGEGAGGLVLATDDAAAAQRELVAAGIQAEPPLALSRPVGELGEARFSLVQLPPESTPGFRTLVCQHHTRDIVWRPEYQRHANGALGIDLISIAVPEPARYAPLLDGLPVKYSSAAEPRITAIGLRVAGKPQGIELKFA